METNLPTPIWQVYVNLLEGKYMTLFSCWHKESKKLYFLKPRYTTQLLQQGCDTDVTATRHVHAFAHMCVSSEMVRVYHIIITRKKRP